MERAILAWEQDEEGEWRALLDCGHKRHFRHDPPRETRPDLGTEATRNKAVGGCVFCGRCDQRLMPDGARLLRSTASFTAETLPAGLRKDHNLKKGIWGHLVVLEGSVIFCEGANRWTVTPDAPFVVLPEAIHHLELTGAVTLRVDFFQ